MTFTELMLKKFPKANLKNLFIACCPCNFGVETKMTEVCDEDSCINDCKICWDSEIINTEDRRDLNEGDVVTAYGWKNRR